MTKNIDYIYKTRPNYWFMVLMIIGAGFMGFVSNLAWHTTKNNIVADIFQILFAGLGLSCLSLAIGFKIIYLTPTEIIITIPAIFYKHTIRLSDIRNLSDKAVMIDIHPNSFSNDNETIGHKVIVSMNDGRKIEMSSLQIGRYREFRKNLRSTVINQGRKTHQ